MTPWLRFRALVYAVLWLVMLAMIFSSCTPAPAEIEWDRCYQSVNPETGKADVTYCTKDSVFHTP